MKESSIIVNLPKSFTVKSSSDKDFDTQSLREINVSKLFIKFLGIDGFVRYRRLIDDLTQLCFKANKSIVEIASVAQTQDNTKKITEDSHDDVVKATVTALTSIGYFSDAIKLLRDLFSEGYIYITETEKMIGLQIKIFEETYNFNELEQIYKAMLTELLKKSSLTSQSDSN